MGSWPIKARDWRDAMLRGTSRRGGRSLDLQAPGSGRKRRLTGIKPLFLAAAMLAAIVAGCGSSGDDNGGGGGGGLDQLTAGWVWYGPQDDGGWNTAQTTGQDAAQDALGDSLTQFNADNVP